MNLHTPTHATCPERFSVLDVTIVILRIRLQTMKFRCAVIPLLVPNIFVGTLLKGKRLCAVSAWYLQH